ncbi:bifunctional riboflavin kinase/FAD synthetase [Helicobacter sp. MIT 21-1697]|uniref:bifunctional riboflavin kinase/FAD synthetase n=1 Tax=Helicobacter sp. MIT 21-1697 TaxID=2993733 RepID=UPI00224B12AA|nr:bifunctional riboflavin kinase/FAD synthetase [Helicobacter sp. MIT 21-1697]MCX2716337.1 bifunctional riboflavin kinase/FAD synthetase [Helicobacter sp. MIT 21-1697]
MKNFLSMPSDKEVQSLALGKFDGMHLAHKELFKYLDKKGALLCIEGKADSASLTPSKERYSPCVIIYVAFEEISQWSGEKFIITLKQKFPSLKRLVVGYDFHFGKNRAFSASDLYHLFVGEVIIMPEYRINGVGVHSSLIKEFVRYGDMDMAAAMLGRYYHLQGVIIKGQNLGSKRLYATINIQTQGYVMPQEGVYASFTKVNETIKPSVCFVGHRLSTDRHFSIESHILDEEIVCQSDMASICFVRKIRDNQSFSDLNLLKERISQDIITSKAILSTAQMIYIDM